MAVSTEGCCSSLCPADTPLSVLETPHHRLGGRSCRSANAAPVPVTGISQWPGPPGTGIRGLRQCVQREREADMGCQGWVGIGMFPGVPVRCTPSPCPLLPVAPCTISHMEKDTEKHAWGKEGSEEVQRSSWSPTAALLPGGKTAEKAFEPQLHPCCQPICCHSSQGPWESHYTASGIAPRQDGICCGSGICLFSNCLLPEQGSHPGRL